MRDFFINSVGNIPALRVGLERGVIEPEDIDVATLTNEQFVDFIGLMQSLNKKPPKVAIDRITKSPIEVKTELFFNSGDNVFNSDESKKMSLLNKTILNEFVKLAKSTPDALAATIETVHRLSYNSCFRFTTDMQNILLDTFKAMSRKYFDYTFRPSVDESIKSAITAHRRANPQPKPSITVVSRTHTNTVSGQTTTITTSDPFAAAIASADPQRISRFSISEMADERFNTYIDAWLKSDPEVKQYILMAKQFNTLSVDKKLDVISSLVECRTYYSPPVDITISYENFMKLSILSRFDILDRMFSGYNSSRLNIKIDPLPSVQDVENIVSMMALAGNVDKREWDSDDFKRLNHFYPIDCKYITLDSVEGTFVNSPEIKKIIKVYGSILESIDRYEVSSNEYKNLEKNMLVLLDDIISDKYSNDEKFTIKEKVIDNFKRSYSYSITAKYFVLGNLLSYFDENSRQGNLRSI